MCSRYVLCDCYYVRFIYFWLSKKHKSIFNPRISAEERVDHTQHDSKRQKKPLLIALTSPGVTQKHADTAQTRLILVLLMAINIIHSRKKPLL